MTGGGERPETWATIVKCLYQAKSDNVARIIEEMYQDGRCSFQVHHNSLIIKWSRFG